MKSLNLKAILAFFVAAAFVMFTQSCDKNTAPQEVVQQLDKEGALIAPSGLVLANSHDELKERFLASQDLTVSLDQVELKNVAYHESEDASLAVANFLIEGEPASALIPLSVDAKKGLYNDGEQVYVKDLDVADKNLVVAGGEDLAKRVDGAARDIIAVCSGSCRCGWSQSGENSYNCGCSPPYAGSCSMGIIIVAPR